MKNISLKRMFVIILFITVVLRGNKELFIQFESQTIFVKSNSENELIIKSSIDEIFYILNLIDENPILSEQFSGMIDVKEREFEITNNTEKKTSLFALDAIDNTYATRIVGLGSYRISYLSTNLSFIDIDYSFNQFICFPVKSIIQK